jgi:nitroreductase
MSAVRGREVEEALAAAITAPSVLNTQLWRLTLEGDAVLVHADRRRASPCSTRSDAS